MNGNVTSSYRKVVSEAREMGLISEHEGKVLCYSLMVLERDIVDIQKEIEDHPRLIAAIGYFYNYLRRQYKDDEETLERMWLQRYSALHQTKYTTGKTSTMARAADVVGKFTDKLVSAQIVKEPEYSALSERAGRLKYMAEQVAELREAYKARTSLLVQYSSNHRAEKKEERFQCE